MDLHAAVPHGLSGGPSKPRPRGLPCECPLAWALPSHPSRGGSPRSIHPRVLGRMSPCPRFSLSASAFPLLWLREPTLLVHLWVAEVGRAGQSPHGDPTAASHPSSCLPQPRHHQPSHEGEWDVSPAAKPPTRRRVSQPFKHPKGLRQLGRSRSCRCFSLPGRAPAACESPLPAPSLLARARRAAGCFWPAVAGRRAGCGLFSPCTRVLSGSGSGMRCQEQMAAIDWAFSQIPVAPGTALGSGSQ